MPYNRQTLVNCWKLLKFYPIGIYYSLTVHFVNLENIYGVVWNSAKVRKFGIKAIAWDAKIGRDLLYMPLGEYLGRRSL